MCGIAGIWHLDGKTLSKEKLQRFTDSLSHRGPDDGSYWIDNSGALGLGHRRLSILDLSPAGNQPMRYANDRYKMIYNGEVFNFLELKKELENKNYHFTTASDTEVILAAFDCWGNDCLSKFNGMWALAIWDEVKQSLFLARDRFGIKPMYYFFKPNNILAFASETYSFKFLDGFNREFNKEHLAYNITDSFCLEAHGHTIYENIFQLLPGHYMEIKTDTTAIKQKRWWNTLAATTKVDPGYAEQVNILRELFFDSIKLRLRSDVPIASALSGGLDSSAVYCGIYHVMNSTAVHERTPDNWQQAFVATFPGTSIDERAYAEQVIEFTKGKVQYIEPDYTNLVNKIKETTLLFDSVYLTPILAGSEVYSAMHQQKIKVSMDGHGVDEMLFGYPSMLEAIARSKQNGSMHVDKDLLETILQMYSPADRARVESGLTTTSAKQRASTLKKIGKSIIPAGIQQLIKKVGLSGHRFGLINQQAITSLSDAPYQTEGMPAESKIPFEAFHTSILPTILRNFDRSSMQHSIEIRMPFMDYRLVSFIFSLPYQSKTGEGFSKRIVRDAMKNYIPESVRTRKWKVGLNAPMKEWFSAELSEFILDEINSASFMQSGVWDGKQVKNFAEKRIKNRSWTWDDCIAFWPVLNAHLLLSNNKKS